MDHKVYREIQAITKLEPKNIIRYYTCWIEALDEEEKRVENHIVKQYIKYMAKVEQENKKNHG